MIKLSRRAARRAGTGQGPLQLHAGNQTLSRFPTNLCHLPKV